MAVSALIPEVAVSSVDRRCRRGGYAYLAGRGRLDGMQNWVVGIVVVCVLGVAVIAYGYFHDRALNRRREAEMLNPPDRPVPGFEQGSALPSYVSELQARRPPAGRASPSSADRTMITMAVDGVAPLALGYASKDFVTDTDKGWAVLTDPLVLVCAEPVAAIRELLPIIELARRLDTGMVIVAPNISDEVLHTLEVNQIQHKLTVLVVTAPQMETLFTIAQQTRAAMIDRSDLQSGYLPPDRVGRCAVWVSSTKQTWIKTMQSTEPDG